MVKLDPIQIAFDKLPQSIKNTAAEYIEGRNIIIKCLMSTCYKSEIEIVYWLEDNDIEVKDLKGYKR